MLSKTKLLAYLLTSIWAYFGGFLLWGILGETLLNDHFGSASGVMRDMPDHFHLALGCIILAVTFTAIYSKWSQGKHSISNGASFGILIGILMGFGSGMIDFSTSNLLTFSGFIINALIYIVYYIIMGALAGMVYGKSK
ncbi:hypothetical protein ACFO5O_13220 [Geojedonia litorea]|uniref:DUF1761 domain-containing protein n=1 Tax=Geojedonia litorea TaxID=1268269 RepID=A0ABV9N8M8_9FLAO